MDTRLRPVRHEIEEADLNLLSLIKDTRGAGGRTERRSGRADLSRRSFRHTRHRWIPRQRSRAHPGKQNQGCTKAWSRPAQEYNQISISVMLPTVAASQAREAVRTRPQAKCTWLQRMVCCSLCPPCGANRRSPRGTSNPMTNRSGVERLANDHEGTCLTLRSPLLS